MVSKIQGSLQQNDSERQHFSLWEKCLTLRFILLPLFMAIPKRIFIVPYRDREEDKKQFIERMHDYLSDSNDWVIYFAHQCDKRPFNRGAVKNIGFLAMKEKYPEHYGEITFIFHDVDTTPRHNGIIHYTTTSGVVSHFYGFEFTLGGMFAIKGKDFEKTKGFPNFWGWGFEDNKIQDRCVEVGLKIDRSCFFKISDKDNIDRKFDGWVRMLSKRDQYVYAMETPDDMTDLKDVNWTIDGEMINISSFTPEMRLEDQDFYNRDIRHGTRVHAHRGYARRNWNMAHMMR